MDQMKSLVSVPNLQSHWADKKPRLLPQEANKSALIYISDVASLPRSFITLLKPNFYVVV